MFIKKKEGKGFLRIFIKGIKVQKEICEGLTHYCTYAKCRNLAYYYWSETGVSFYSIYSSIFSCFIFIYLFFVCGRVKGIRDRGRGRGRGKCIERGR